MKAIARIIVSIFFLSIVADVAQSTERIALVIGNSQYQHTGPLKNPMNDANLMEKSLTKAGFEVTKILDADLRTMRRAILEFGRALRNKNEAGLFYYAGHGVQVRGENFLLPVSAKITDEDEIELEAININSFLRVMNASASAVNIVVLDACRDNPFARSFRSASRGLAPVDAPKGTYIAYSTAPGDAALDGDGINSPYTKSLANAISTRGIAIEQVFKKARVDVLNQTNNKQVPWETSSITGDFYFHQKVNVEAKVATTKQLVNSAVNEAERVYNQIKDTTSAAVLRQFANEFSETIYSRLALARVEELQPAKSSNQIAKRLQGSSTPSQLQQIDQFENLQSQWASIRNSENEGQIKEFMRSAKGTHFENKATQKLNSIQIKKGQEYLDRGIFYDTKNSADANYELAVEFYRKAIRYSNPSAHYRLAILLMFGLGVERDFDQAAVHLLRSAELGNDELAKAIITNIDTWNDYTPLVVAMTEKLWKRGLYKTWGEFLEINEFEFAIRKLRKKS